MQNEFKITLCSSFIFHISVLQNTKIVASKTDSTLSIEQEEVIIHSPIVLFHTQILIFNTTYHMKSQITRSTQEKA